MPFVRRSPFLILNSIPSGTTKYMSRSTASCPIWASWTFSSMKAMRRYSISRNTASFVFLFSKLRLVRRFASGVQACWWVNPWGCPCWWCIHDGSAHIVAPSLLVADEGDCAGVSTIIYILLQRETKSLLHLWVAPVAHSHLLVSAHERFCQPFFEQYSRWAKQCHLQVDAVEAVGIPFLLHVFAPVLEFPYSVHWVKYPIFSLAKIMINFEYFATTNLNFL